MARAILKTKKITTGSFSDEWIGGRRLQYGEVKKRVSSRGNQTRVAKLEDSRPVRPLSIRRGDYVHPVGLDVFSSISLVNEGSRKSGEVDVISEDLFKKKRVSRPKERRETRKDKELTLFSLQDPISTMVGGMGILC